MDKFQFIRILAILIVNLICMIKLIYPLTLTMLLVTSGCSTQMFAMQEELYVPQVQTESSLNQYKKDANACRSNTLKAYVDKNDARNINRDFRACLIEKGYKLLS